MRFPEQKHIVQNLRSVSGLDFLAIHESVNHPTADRIVEEELREIVGPEWVVTKNETEKIQDYLMDMADYPSEPLAVTQPESADQVSKIVQLAAKSRVHIVARGGGTSVTGASSTNGGIVIDFSKRMNKILEVDIVNWYVHCQAGVVLEDLNAELEKHGFFFPPDPSSASWCTVGGVISENSGGMKCFKYGTVEDWVLALQIVLHNGTIAKVGEPLPKNRVGYDLVHLLCGSEGTLAITTEAWLKIIPLPKDQMARKRMLIFFDEWSKIGDAIANIRKNRIQPVLMEFIDLESIRAVNSAFQLNVPEGEAILFIETDSDVEKILEICKQSKSVGSYVAKDKSDEERLYNARALIYLAMKDKATGTYTEDVVVPLHKMAEYLDLIKQTSKKYGVKIPTNGHAGDGNVHPLVLFDKSSKESTIAAQKAVEEICEYAIRVGGSVTGEHGVGIQKMAFAEKQLRVRGGDEVLGLMREIKSLWDPENILNPNKFISK